MSETLELGTAEHPATSVCNFLRNPRVQRKFRAMLDVSVEDIRANPRRRSKERAAESRALTRALLDGVPPIEAALLYDHPLDLVIERARLLRKRPDGGKVAPAYPTTCKRPDYPALVKKSVDSLISRRQLPATFELPKDFFGNFKRTLSN